MSIRTIRAAAGLVLALALAWVAIPGTGADASPSSDSAPSRSSAIVEASVSDPVTMPLIGTAPVYSPSPYADAPRDLSTPPAPEPAPAPAATPAPAPAPAPAAPGSIRAIIQRHFGAAAVRAEAIARCESSLNPNAVSRTNDHGLFQINISHRAQFEAVTGAPWSAIYDPELNTIYAKWLYDREGWSPWSCSRRV